MSHLIAPSILASNFLNLHKTIELIENSDADWYHFDVMDGRFVPNISFGFPILDAIQKNAKKEIDVHLMIVEPEKYIEKFVNSGASTISVHIEASTHLHRNLQAIKSLGAKAGIAVNPHTSVSLIEPVLEEADLVCLMSVNPGFGGQKFIHSTLKKIECLAKIIEQRGLNTLIEIDGGVTLHNAKDILNAGANVLVAGSSVFKAENPTNAISQFKGM